jgi:hypothetical protein
VEFSDRPCAGDGGVPPWALPVPTPGEQPPKGARPMGPHILGIQDCLCAFRVGSTPNMRKLPPGTANLSGALQVYRTGFQRHPPTA